MFGFSFEIVQFLLWQEMASDELKQMRAKLTKEAINDHQMSYQGGTRTTLFKCGRCGKRDCTYNQVRLVTIFYCICLFSLLRFGSRGSKLITSSIFIWFEFRTYWSVIRHKYRGLYYIDVKVPQWELSSHCYPLMITGTDEKCWWTYDNICSV